MIQSVDEHGRPSKIAQEYKRKSCSIFTGEFIAALHEWIKKKNTDFITVSPKLNDTVWIIDPITKEKVQAQKMFYTTNIRELHTAMCLPVEQGGFWGARNARGKVQTSDTMLRNLLLKNISKMTNNSHMELCGCESLHFISKHMVFNLNEWCTWAYKAMAREANKPENAGEKEKKLEEAKLFRSWSKNEDSSPKFEHPRGAIDESNGV